MKPIVKFITFGAICAGLALAQHTPPNPATMVQYRVQHLTKVLTLTAGTRHFRFSNSQVGSLTQGFTCFEQGTPPNG